MKLNSSISCEEIDPGEFPSPCPGDRPFTVFWERFIDTDVRICVPGSYIACPWSLRHCFQELIKEIYLEIKDKSFVRDDRSGQDWWDSENPPFNTSYTIRCTETTTRRYFEQGKDWNNNTYGTLLEQ
jgi:hypothetical protein